jgi:hypothetical protein
MVDLTAGSGVVCILVDGVLHLTEKVVDVNQILLGAGVRHGKIILLSQGVLARGGTSMNNRWTSRLRHVLLRCGHWTIWDGEGAMKGHQGAANLSVRRGVNLATLGAAEEVIDHLKGAFAVIATGCGAIAQMLSSRGVQRRLVEV